MEYLLNNDMDLPFQGNNRCLIRASLASFESRIYCNLLKTIIRKKKNYE